MARLIDANAFIKEHCADCKYFNVDGICTKEYPVCGSVVIVAELPTIDAVEVVRCKDCKHYNQEMNECESTHFWFSEDGCLNAKDDDYCSFGERKNNCG